MEDTPNYGTKVPAIYSALNGIMSAITPIAKDGYNGFHKFKFRSIDQLVDQIHPIFKEHNVIIVPTLHSHEILERDTNRDGKQYYSNMVISYALTSTIDGSIVTCLVAAGAADNGDKHFSKALSMGLKYMLNQMFLIPTGDPDPDGDVHDVGGNYKPEEKPKVPSVPKAENNDAIFATCTELYKKHRNKLTVPEVNKIDIALASKDVAKVKTIIAFLKGYDDDSKGV